MRGSRQVGRWLAGLLGVLLSLASGCVTPTIPLPPPDPDKVTFALDATGGTATFRYDADADYAGEPTLVYILNETQGRGLIVTADPADGSVSETPPFPGVDGDAVLIWFERDDSRGSMCLFLHDGRSGEGNECG